MPNLLEQLENNEAVLLMYVAGELADEDRAEVEQLLATDGNLRAELARLRGTVVDANALMGVADAHGRLPVAEQVAVRGAVRAMRRWRLENPPRPVAMPARAGLRYAWWAYPASAAAVVLLAALVGWGFRSDVGAGSFAGLGPGRMAPYVPGEFVVETPRDEFAQADPLDQAYLEIQSIAELSSDGM